MNQSKLNQLINNVPQSLKVQYIRNGLLWKLFTKQIGGSISPESQPTVAQLELVSPETGSLEHRQSVFRPGTGGAQQEFWWRVVQARALELELGERAMELGSAAVQGAD